MSKRSVDVENHEKYFISVEEVRQQIERCPKCGEKVEFTHLTDHENMYLHEETQCKKCGHGPVEILHTLN